MNEPIPKILEITPSIKKYAWGVSNSQSWVGAFSPDKQGPFAEAWFGAHPNGSAQVIVGDKKISLDVLLKERGGELMSELDLNAFNGQMPFLSKILSIAQPLSIQLHPAKHHAVRLHSLQPEIYPDPYAKDEASVAITDVSLLHSFRSMGEIRLLLKSCKELSKVIEIDSSASEPWRLFEQIMNLDSGTIGELCQKLYRRLEAKPSSELSEEENWVLRCQELYPQGDRGIFCIYLLNIVHLQPGEAISLKTGTPHAYLSGELLEIMKPSDNVLRCGLTSKLVDVAELLNCLDKAALPPSKILHSGSESVKNYNFAKQGFAVQQIFGPVEMKFETRQHLHVAISLDANGRIGTAEGDFFLDVSPAKAYLLGTTTEPFRLDLSSGKIAMFSYQAAE